MSLEPLEELFHKVTSPRWNDPIHDAVAFVGRCGHKALARMIDGRLSVVCSGSCWRDDIIGAAALGPPASQASDHNCQLKDQPSTSRNGANPNNSHGLGDDVRAAIRSNPQLAYEGVLGAALIRKPGSREPVARCPLHDDGRPSLRVNLEKGTWYCDPCAKGGDLFDLAREVWGLDFPGCTRRLAELLSVNGYSNANRAPRSPKSTTSRTVVRRSKYEIRDLDGTLKATHKRVDFDDGTKDMPWDPVGIKPAGLPLFQIEKTTDSMDRETVVLCEGEKAAAALWERRTLAVGTVVGADLSGHKVHCDESLKALLRFDVVLWPDNDEAGRRHMQVHGEALLRLGCESVRRIEWREAPPKGDAANFTGTDEELQTIIDAALIIGTDDGNQLIIVESQSDAVTANAKYLERRAVVDRLLYAQSISLVVGGKHHGKTTGVRTLALCTSRGLPWLGRETAKGHVLYVASDDELASTRMMLLKMGWDPNADQLELVHLNPEIANATPDKVLLEITELAKRRGAVLIILDMLFDFTAIKDELSYAGTRDATRPIQSLADQTGAHVLSTHHSPKYMLEAAAAATAALGSQGIAARFSPIVLVRHWGADLYTVESTTVRDPRGVAITSTCIVLDANGWAQASGPFKNYMKWKLYAPRVKGLLESGEPGTEYTVDRVMRDLEIGRSEVQNTLYQLYKAGEIQREKRGKSYRYFVGPADGLFEANQDG